MLEKTLVHVSLHNSSLVLVQSLNSLFFPSPMGAEFGRVKRESRIVCMRMLRTPPFPAINDAYSLSIRVPTTINFTNRFFTFFLPQHQRQRKYFSFQSASWKRHCATHWEVEILIGWFWACACKLSWTLFSPARVQPLMGVGRRESSGTGLRWFRYARGSTNCLGPPHTSRHSPTRRFEI